MLWVLVSLSFLALTFTGQIRSGLQLTTFSLEDTNELYGARGAALYAFRGLRPSISPTNKDRAGRRTSSADDTPSPELPPILKELPIFKDLSGENKQEERRKSDISKETSGISGQNNGISANSLDQEGRPYWTPDLDPYEVKITDRDYLVSIRCENGKLNLNLASSEMLRKFFLRKGLSIIETQTLVESIRDWIDEDDYARLQGAESKYYQSLPAPYQCKNGLFENIEEVVLVRGMTPALFEAIRGEITVFGTSARINVNFASGDVLSIIPNMPRALARELVLDRDTYGPFETMDQVKEVAGPSYDDISPHITVDDGGVFSIEAGAKNSRPRVNLVVSSGKITRSYFY